MVSCFVAGDGKQTCPFSYVLPHFLHSLIPNPQARPPTVPLGSFRCLTSASPSIRLVAPPSPPSALPPGPRPCLDPRNPCREGPPPPPAANGGAAPPRPAPPAASQAGLGLGCETLRLLALLLGFGKRAPRRHAARPWKPWTRRG